MIKNRDLTNYEICEKYELPMTLTTNIVEEHISKNKVKAVLGMISKALSKTLGFYGEASIVRASGHSNHLITKDGYDIINRISFTDEVASTVLDLLKQVSAAQVSQVGDGSTSAIVVAEALYSRLSDLEGYAQKDIIDILKTFEYIIEEEVKKISKPITDIEDLTNVAKISLNNDETSGNLIKTVYDVVGPEGFISTDFQLPTKTDYIEYQKGMELFHGYIDKCFVDNRADDKVVYETFNGENPLIVLLDIHLNLDNRDDILIPLLGEVCINMNRPVLFVLTEYTAEIHLFLRNNRMQHKMKNNTREMDFTVISMDQAKKSSINNMKDLALMCGCEPYNISKCDPKDFKANIQRFIGSAEKITVTNATTQIIARSDLPTEKQTQVDNKVKELMNELNEKDAGEEMIDPMEAYEIRRRVSNLTNGTAIIHVGGESYTERMSRERLFEDAILAARSALKNGVIPGGNLTIPSILTDKRIREMAYQIQQKFNHINVEIIIEIGEMIRDSLLESFANVLANAGFNVDEAVNMAGKCAKNKKIMNLKTRKYENFKDTKIVNSCMTDIQILKSVISIIGMLASSFQYIIIHQELSNLGVNNQKQR